MSASELLAALKADGIEIRCVDGKLGITDPKQMLTEDRRTLIRAHKAALVATLSSTLDTKNAGSQLSPTTDSEITSSDNKYSKLEASKVHFKKYKLPDGSVQSFTQEEFQQVVEIFRLLLNQDLKSRQNGSAA